jgi:hypothetical protein
VSSNSPAIASWDGGASFDDGPAPLTADATACRPGDVQTYQPMTYHPATAAGQGLCRADSSAADPIRLFYDACLGAQATAAACIAFQTDKATKACAECILTSDSKSYYGPLIDHGGFITTNVAGCIELTDRSGLSCAKALQALQGCELAACEANCPVHDAPSRTAYDACAVSADHMGCQSYGTAARCTATENDASLAASCLFPDFQDFYNAVVPLFCGTPHSRNDAAGAAEADASIDASQTGPDAALVDNASDGPGDASTDATPAEASIDAAKD